MHRELDVAALALFVRNIFFEFQVDFAAAVEGTHLIPDLAGDSRPVTAKNHVEFSVARVLGFFTQRGAVLVGGVRSHQPPPRSVKTPRDGCSRGTRQ